MAKRNRPKRQVPVIPSANKPRITDPVVLAISPMVAAGYIKKSLENLMKAGYLLRVGKDPDGHMLVIFRGFEGAPLDNNRSLHVQPIAGHFVPKTKEEGIDVG